MLDDMGVLRRAVEDYRAAATAWGVDWPAGGDQNAAPPLDVLCRVFDVDQVAEQAIWLKSQAWAANVTILPQGAFVLAWPVDPAELLTELGACSLATPFHWRHQLPLFGCDHLLFTFVLAGPNEGEIWRYQVDVDDWNPVRTAPSLSTLFTQWTQGFAADVYVRGPYHTWFHIGDGRGDPIDLLTERTPAPDPFAFPVFISSILHGDRLRTRQRECGVDLDLGEQFEEREELSDAVYAARAALRR